MELQKLFVTLALKADEYKQGLQEAAGQAEGFRGRVGGIFNKVAGIGTAAFLGVGAAAVGGFALAGNAAINMNSQLETSTLQFTTLMGDSDRAQEHVRSLFDFAARTPFETGPIIEASRIMQVFGGDALNTDENLTRIGDTAAAVGAPIEDIGFWVGRAYAAIQGGQPFGEAAQNLMQMGAVSPDVIARMNELRDAGASQDEIFAVLTEHLDTYGGAMEAQAGTWQGLMATIRDSLNMTAATALKPFFDIAKEGLASLAVWLNSPEVQAGITALAEKLAVAAQAAVEFFANQVVPFLQEHGPTLVKILAMVAVGFGALSIIATVAGWISSIAAAASVVMPIITAVAGVLSGPVLLAIGAVIAIIALLKLAWDNNWGGIRDAVNAAWAVIQPILAAVVEWVGKKIKEDIERLKVIWSDYVWPAIQSAIERVWPVIERIFKAISDFVTNTLIPTIQMLWKRWTEEIWPDIQTVTENVWKIVEEIFTEIGRWVNDNIVPWIEFLNEKWSEEVWPAIQAAVETMWELVKPIWESIKEWLAVTLPPIIESFKGAFESGMSAISSAIQPVKDLWDRFSDAVKGFWDWISGKVFSFNISIPDLPEWAIPGSPIPLHTAWLNFANDMPGIGEKISDGFETMADSLTDLLDPVQEMHDGINGMLGLGDKVGGLAGGFANHFQRLVTDPLKAQMETLSGTVTAAGKIYETVFRDNKLKYADDSTLKTLNQLFAVRGRLNERISDYRARGVSESSFLYELQSLETVNQAIDAFRLRNDLNYEFVKQQEKLLALEKARADMDFLKQQMELLNLIRDNKIPMSVLNGVQLGLGADPGQLMSIMVGVMETIVRKTSYELANMSNSPAVTSATPGTSPATTMNVQTQNINGGQHIYLYDTEESELERLGILSR